MRHIGRLIISLLACVGLLSAPQCPAQLTTAERDQLLADHNQVRSTVNPTAANMTRLVWDPALATVAQNWANQCRWAHNPNAAADYAALSSNGGGAGENIFVTTAPRAIALAGANSGVTLWGNERVNYNYATNSCAAGQDCGHYTQMVWARTVRVGCAIRQCASMVGLPATFANAQFLVCNYNPAGNFIGQRPYIQGTPGSQCPAGYSAVVNGLCSPPSAPGGPPISSILSVIQQLLLDN